MNLRRPLRPLIDFRYVFLAAAVVLGIAAALVGRQLTLDRSIENMFADDDPILAPYERLKQTFGQHEIVLAIYREPNLTLPFGLRRVEQLATGLKQIDGVVAAVSILDLPRATDFEDDPIGKRFREVFSGYTHNTSLDAAGVLCLIERAADNPLARRTTLAAMRRAVASSDGGMLVGEPVLIEEAFDLLDADGVRLNTWCTGLVLLTIFASFRRLRWTLLPLAVVQLALAATRATLVLNNVQLSMVSSMLAAIVTVVASRRWCT